MRKLELLIDDAGEIEVVFNACHGGFGVSKEAILRMIELGSESAKKCYDEQCKYQYTKSFYPDVPRFDPILIQVVKELKNKASGQSASLAIGKVHIDNLLHIDNFDGNETIRYCFDYEDYGRYDDEYKDDDFE